MKTALFATTLVLLASACAPTVQNPYKNTNMYGYSSDVEIYYRDADDKGTLPNQISVHLEQPHDKYSALSVGSNADISELIFPDSIQEIGCENTPNTMPEFLEADTLVLCGDLNFEGQILRYKARTIIFKSANIKIVATQENLKYLGAVFQAQEKLIFNGQSKITLQGATLPNNSGLDLAPNLKMAAGTIEGEGHLQIESKSSYMVYGK